MSRHVRCPGPITRRDFVRIGSAAVGGLGLADLLRLRAAASPAGVGQPDTAVLLVWLPGGPPHLDTYDLKPAAPAEIRGDFRPMRTVVPGLEICELFPRQARVADRFSLIRSISHRFADHGGGHKRFLTGRDPKQPDGFVNDAPCVGSIVSRERGSKTRSVPNYVALVDGGRAGVDTFSFGAAYLGAATTPFIVEGNPNAPTFQVSNLSLAPGLADRLSDRMTLLDHFDRLRREVDRNGAMRDMDSFNRQALDLLTSDNARRAFDLSLEDDRTRDLYGRHAYGQRALLGRRLIEAGATFVTVVMENPCPGEQFPPGVLYNWDSHAVNGHIFDDARFRFPRYDQAVAALVEDLHARGLDRRVLLVVTGEFGRTPRLENLKGRPGRDHWPGAMSVLVAGGGLRMGQVVGSTNKFGEHPQERPLTPNDLWATMYRHLGIDASHTFPDLAGRPVAILPDGEPIAELTG